MKRVKRVGMAFRVDGVRAPREAPHADDPATSGESFIRVREGWMVSMEQVGCITGKK